MTLRACTRYLTLSFGRGLLDEIETECSYCFTPADPAWDQRADVELSKVMAHGIDIRPILPEGLERKLEASILTDELTGVFS